MREERVALEHHVDRPPVGRHAGQVGPAENDPPGARRLEPGQEPHQRGLAAAGRTEQAKELALEDVERHVVDCGGRAEALGDALEADQGHGAGIVPRSEGAAGRSDRRAGEAGRERSKRRRSRSLGRRPRLLLRLPHRSQGNGPAEGRQKKRSNVEGEEQFGRHCTSPPRTRRAPRCRASAAENQIAIATNGGYG